jgi:xanthine dehydrogenase YagS FAD-binding subunit
MNSFEWIDVHTVDEAIRLLSEGGSSQCVVAKAGGVDLLDLMKEGIVHPNRVINLRTIPNLNEIRIDEHGALQLGALATLAQIASDAHVMKNFSALAAAAEHAATPQVRNVATIGGNLLQRPRCWYFRNAHFERQHVEAAAREGENPYHGVFDTDRTPLVHASTPATALLAYGATVHVVSSRSKRSIPISEFFLPPDPKRESDVVMHPDEVLTHVTVPASAHGTVSVYRKQTERDSYDWPICDVAVVLQLKPNRTVDAATIALGWVAPTPTRASAAEALIKGRVLDEEIARQAARAAVMSAKPLSRNAYKVKVLETVIERTVLAAGGA